MGVMVQQCHRILPPSRNTKQDLFQFLWLGLLSRSIIGNISINMAIPPVIEGMHQPGCLLHRKQKISFFNSVSLSLSETVPEK